MINFPGLYKAIEEASKKKIGFVCPHCKEKYIKLLYRDNDWICESCEDKKKK